MPVIDGGAGIPQLFKEGYASFTPFDRSLFAQSSWVRWWLYSTAVVEFLSMLARRRSSGIMPMHTS